MTIKLPSEKMLSEILARAPAGRGFQLDCSGFAQAEIDFIYALHELLLADKLASFHGNQMITWKSYLNEVNYERAFSKAVKNKNVKLRAELVTKQNFRRLSYFGCRLGFVNGLLRLQRAIVNFERCRTIVSTDFLAQVNASYPEVINELRFDQFKMITSSPDLKLYSSIIKDLCIDAIAGAGPAILAQAYRDCQVGLYQPIHGSIYELVGVENGNQLDTVKAAGPLTLIDDSWRTRDIKLGDARADDMALANATGQICSMFRDRWMDVPVDKRPFSFPILDALVRIKKMHQHYGLLNQPQFVARRQEILESSSVEDAELLLRRCDEMQLSHQKEFVAWHRSVQQSLKRLGEFSSSLKSYRAVHGGGGYLDGLGKFTKMVAMYNFVAATVINRRLELFLCAEKGKTKLHDVARSSQKTVDEAAEKRSSTRKERVDALVDAICGGETPSEDDIALRLLRGVDQNPVDYRVP